MHPPHEDLNTKTYDYFVPMTNSHMKQRPSNLSVKRSCDSLSFILTLTDLLSLFVIVFVVIVMHGCLTNQSLWWYCTYIPFVFFVLLILSVSLFLEFLPNTHSLSWPLLINFHVIYLLSVCCIYTYTICRLPPL